MKGSGVSAPLWYWRYVVLIEELCIESIAERDDVIGVSN